MRVDPRPAARRVVFTVLAAATVAFTGSSALAQTGPELILKPFPKELAFDGEADGSITDTGHSKQTDASIKIGIAETQGRVRLTPGDEAGPRFGYQFKYFDVDNDVPGLPRQLYDQSAGVAVAVAKFDDWIVGVSGGVGYAGQAPFGDGNAYYFQADVVAFKKLTATSAIAVGLDYNGNRTYKPDVPFPGVAYTTRVREDLSLTVGVPVTGIKWEPNNKFRVEVNYLLLDNFNARAGYTFGKGFELFGAIGLRTDAFFLDGAPDSNDRLLFQQKRAEVGLTVRTKDAGLADPDIELTAAVGYAWDGEFSVGFDSSNSTLLTDVSDTPYLRLSIEARF
jgi:hypothetical protein